MRGRWLTWLAGWGLLALGWGCSSGPASRVVPIMGLNEPGQEEIPIRAVADSGVAAIAPDSISPLAQRVLFMPFRDRSKYKGSWNVHLDLPRSLEDTLRANPYLRSLPLDSALVRLDKKERRGEISRERALAVGRELGVDYVVLGEIVELSMKRFRATVPIGGYRSYEGVTELTLWPFKVIDGQLIGEVTRQGREDSKRYGITNPAAFVPYEKEYYLLSQVEWGSTAFHQTLLGRSVGQCLSGLAAALDSLIRPSPALTVSEPKIIDIEGDRAYINIGLADSVENGNKFGVWDKGRELKDPQTGAVLGQALPRRVGVVQVEQVLNEHLSLVRILEGQEDIRREYSIRAE